jgi:voltage-gated potassium channel
MISRFGRLRTGFILLAIVLIVGTAGYIWFERLDPLVAFYSAVLVVSTLGFGDFTPDSRGGLLLTIGLIFTGVGTLYYLLGTFAETLIETSLGTQRERRMERKIAQLRKHYIICGYGRVGRNAAHELASEKCPFVIVDKHAETVEAARSDGFAAILGDATEDAVLREAGVNRAAGLLVTTASDAANVFITLTARAFNDELRIVARASTESTESKLVKAGANSVIAPEVVGGQRMAALVLRPETTSLVDSLTLSQNEHNWIDEMVIQDQSPLCGLTLEATQLHTRTGVRVIAIRHNDGRLITNPGGDEQLLPGDVLISVGDHQQLLEVEKLGQPRADAVVQKG